MIRSRTLLALGIAALPFVVQAQTANTPGGSASTGTPIEQTKTAPGKLAPGTTATSPSATNPEGSLPSKGSSSSMKKSDSKMSGPGKTAATPPAGEVPTYPAPAKDGTPTK